MKADRMKVDQMKQRVGKLGTALAVFGVLFGILFAGVMISRQRVMASEVEIHKEESLDSPAIRNVSIYSKTSMLVTIDRVKGASGYYIYNIS